MKFAEVDGLRREASPGLSGKCCVCGSVALAKCGQLRAWHWSHRNLSACDHWWEPETEWHRKWKNQFAEENQEIIQLSVDSEKHVAVVKTLSGLVIEFQHSHLHPDERRAREAFYKGMVWVVDGTRRTRDKLRFFENRRTEIGFLIRQPIYSLASQDGSLLRDWNDSPVPVYFDFGDSEPTLWRLNPSNRGGPPTVFLMPKVVFIHGHREGQPFESRFTGEIERVAAEFAKPQIALPRPLPGFERYAAFRTRRHRRL
jgi:competence protein CoiA